MYNVINRLLFLFLYLFLFFGFVFLYVQHPDGNILATHTSSDIECAAAQLNVSPPFWIPEGISKALKADDGVYLTEFKEHGFFMHTYDMLEKLFNSSEEKFFAKTLPNQDADYNYARFVDRAVLVEQYRNDAVPSRPLLLVGDEDDAETPSAAELRKQPFSAQQQFPIFPPGEVLLNWKKIQFPMTPSCHPFITYGFDDWDSQALFHLMTTFARIATKLNVTWYSEAGTTIGSVRHWAPIPWDDDLDLRLLEADWQKFYNYVKEGNEPSLEVYDSPNRSGFRGKVWLKNYSLMTRPSLKWRYPFLDIWSLEPTESGGFRLYEEDDVTFAAEDIFPLHYRPFGPMWIPFAQNPFECIRKKDYKNTKASVRPKFLETCLRTTYQHKVESPNGKRTSVPCENLATALPLVTRRIRRSDCPYDTPTTEKNPSRVLNCLGREFSRDTKVVVVDPEDKTNPFKEAFDQTKNSRPTDKPITEVISEIAQQFFWHFKMPELTERLDGGNFLTYTKQHCLEDTSRHPGGFCYLDDMDKLPVQFVIESPKEKCSNLNKGIIEELSLAGVPFGAVEICDGDYSAVFI